MRRLVLLLAGAVLLGGCGSQSRGGTTADRRGDDRLRHRPPARPVARRTADRRAGDGRRRRHEPPRPRRTRHDRRALGAQRPPRRRAHAARCRRARARHDAPRRPATASAPCASRSARIPSRRSGSTAARCSGRCTAPTRTRTQAQPTIRVRPPFRVVWSRGLGTLIEFPAVVAGRRRVHREREGHRARDLDAQRRRRSGGTTRRTARWPSSPAVWRRPAGRARDGRPRLGAAPLRRQAALALHRRLAGRVVARDRRRRRRRLRRLERDGHRARPADAQRVRWRRYGGCKVTSSAALAGSTLYIGDYCGRLLALNARNGATRWSRAASTAASTARRRSRPAACSSRARPAAR